MANMSAKFMKNAFIGWTETTGLYYPADFDPSKLVSEKKYNREKRDQPKKPRMMNIRMMMPFSMICNTCGNFSYIGTKFNSRVEKVQNEAYFGCAIYRFYGKCQHCSSEFTFKTDPETADYVMESGGRRNYEAWKDADGAVASVAKHREEEAEFDNMKALEQASVSAAAEMQINDALEELQQLNKRTKNHDEAILNAIDFLYNKHYGADTNGQDGMCEDFEEELEAYRNEQLARKRQKLDEIDSDVPTSSSSTSPNDSAKRAKTETQRAAKTVQTMMPPIRIKKKHDVSPVPTETTASPIRTEAASSIRTEASSPIPTEAAAPGPLLGGYDSESSDS